MSGTGAFYIYIYIYIHTWISQDILNDGVTQVAQVLFIYVELVTLALPSYSS